MVAYDGSDESKRALNLALSLFKKGDHVVLACIVPTPRTAKFVNITTSLIGGPPAELAGARPSASGEYRFDRYALLSAESSRTVFSDYSSLEKVQKALLEVLDSEASAFAKQGISTACHVLQGDPKTRLKRLVEFHGCDIVVMGRRRRGASQAPLSHR